MTGKPSAAKIDVLIPAYNAESTLQAAVASIQSQTVSDIRIIVVNDGSTDRTGEILAEMAQEDARITILTRPNGGIVSALNAGLEISTAEYIARHDADDLAYPNRFREQLSFLEGNPPYVAVGSNVHHIDQDGKLIGTQSRFAGDVEPDPDWLPSKEPYLMHPFLMVRREAIEKVGGYRYVVHAEDTDLYWRLLNIGRLHNLPAIHGEYRIHSGSISSASILNGRIAATASQLAALSYKRRVKGVPDIEFSPELRSRYEKLQTLDNIINFVGNTLNEEEHRYLKAATSAKLLSLMEYRPYDPDRDDCAFMGAALSDANIRSSTNKRIVSRLKGKAVFRLLKKGKFSEALALQPSLGNILRAAASDFKNGILKRKPRNALTT